MRAPKTSKQFELPPEDRYPARCVGVVDVGSHASQYGTKRKLRLTWELIGTKREDGNPFLISREYTFSMFLKSGLAAAAMAMVGSLSQQEADELEVEDLLNQACEIEVVHATKGEKTYANVGAVLRLRKGDQVAEAVTGPQFLSLDAFDPKVYADLPDWLKAKIASAPEFAHCHEEEDPF